jgi:hypothetical protein
MARSELRMVSTDAFKVLAKNFVSALILGVIPNSFAGAGERGTLRCLWITMDVDRMTLRPWTRRGCSSVRGLPLAFMSLRQSRKVPLLHSFGSQVRDDTILSGKQEMISSMDASPSPVERSS